MQIECASGKNTEKRNRDREKESELEAAGRMSRENKIKIVSVI